LSVCFQQDCPRTTTSETLLARRRNRIQEKADDPKRERKRKREKRIDREREREEGRGRERGIERRERRKGQGESAPGVFPT